MMLASLLARAGIDVTVLEKHADFLSDFRGEPIHPSTLEVEHELGLLDEFLQVAAPEGAHRSRRVRPRAVHLVDFSHLPTRCKFMP